jgi:hypothetical protein
MPDAIPEFMANGLGIELHPDVPTFSNILA